MPSWKKVIISGSDAELNSLNITTALTASGLIYPTTDGLVNQSIVTDGLGNLSFGNPYSDNTVVYGKNLSGTTIPKGTPLYFTGSGTSGNLVGVFPADASNPARMPAGGIAGEQLLDEAEGVILLDGFINGVNTSAFNSGDLVYVAVGGGYTNVAPTGSTNLIQTLGYVEKVGVSNGSGVIKGPGVFRSVPNIQQGYTWVGNADDVATPVATSSLSVASAVSASFALTSSLTLSAVSASFATTASYAFNAVSASFATTASYVFGFGETTKLFQLTASTTWSFSHNLGEQYPQIDVYDGTNKIIIPSEIEAIDSNNMLIYFATPTSGVAAASVGGTATTASYATTFTIESVTLKTDENIDVDTGTEVISTVSTIFYDGAFFDYRIKNGPNLRVGTVTAVWSGSTAEYTDVSTNDIGNTSPVTMSVDVSSSFARLLATTSTDDWDIKTFVRMI
jgi:hypothetical protein